jgi:YrbI family 3-deoxy-D-manno-octulosonate 8-phosphate phosphatase
VAPADAGFAQAAANVRVLGMDFDGVMTNNAVYLFEDGREAVRCSRFEGFGLRRVEACGVYPIIVSTEANKVVTARARKLKIEARQNIDDKVQELERILAAHSIGWEALCFIGNDVNDLGVLQRAGLPVIVADAHESVQCFNFFRTRTVGGAGAVRELCDAIAAVKEGGAAKARGGG